MSSPNECAYHAVRLDASEVSVSDYYIHTYIWSGGGMVFGFADEVEWEASGVSGGDEVCDRRAGDDRSILGSVCTMCE